MTALAHLTARHPELAPLRVIEEEWIAHTLERLGGNVTQAAKALGISRSTLKRKLGASGSGPVEGSSGSWPALKPSQEVVR